MRARLSQLLNALRTGFWFVPSAMLVLAALLALVLLYIDGRYDPGMKSSIAWAYSGGPEGARSLLSTIAGSMITAASVTSRWHQSPSPSRRSSMDHVFCAIS